MKAYQVHKLIINGAYENTVPTPKIFIDRVDAIKWAIEQFGDKYWWQIEDVDLELPNDMTKTLDQDEIPKEHEAVLFLNRFRLYL